MSNSGNTAFAENEVKEISIQLEKNDKPCYTNPRPGFPMICRSIIADLNPKSII
jgi:hypothetical protein